MQRAVLIFHADAGGGEHDESGLRQTLSVGGFDADICAVDADAIRAALPDGRYDRAVVAGGDGTVALAITVAGELRNAGHAVPPIAILPIGGLNNIACTFGMAGNVGDIVAGWAGGRMAEIDVGLARGPWGRRCFVEAAGFGALSDGLSGITVSPEGQAQKKAVGRAAFADALASAEPSDAVVTLDGERVEEALLMLEVLNIPRIGPRLAFAPDADPADGRLDALLVRPQDRCAMLDWLHGDCAAPCPVAPRRAAQIRVDGEFDRCRLDDPKRDRPVDDAAITLSTMPRRVALHLPRQQPGTGDCV